MFPLALVDDLGKVWAYLIYLLIGIAFGVALEVAGFANSRKLAAQFYLKDMTVLKVMFTAIVTAMILVFLASAVGLLEYNRVYVNTTYLWPGIVGGFIMGVGFVFGGFCPGTSLVALASLKIDGVFFFLGLLVGVFLFGESVSHFSDFWFSSYMGRFTIPTWLGLSTGVVVMLVVLMALAAFWMAERGEAMFGHGVTDACRYSPRVLRLGAGTAVVAALAIVVLGQPTPVQKWMRMAADQAPLLEDREVQIAPGELVDLAGNNQIRLKILDVRDEADYNLFHLLNAERLSMADLEAGRVSADFIEQPANTITVLVSNDEARATEAWKLLTGEGMINVYLLAGGLNGWLDEFAPEVGCEGCRRVAGPAADAGLRYAFDSAMGSDRPVADPFTFHEMGMFFIPKVKLQVRTVLKGGCG